MFKIIVCRPGEDPDQNDSTKYSFEPGTDFDYVLSSLEKIVRDAVEASGYSLPQVAEPLASMLEV